jgi:hypothetical protein
MAPPTQIDASLIQIIRALTHNADHGTLGALPQGKKQSQGKEKTLVCWLTRAEGRIRTLGEAWILEQAGIVFDAKAELGKLRAV